MASPVCGGPTLLYRTCLLDDCCAIAERRNWCRPHYDKLMRLGLIQRVRVHAPETLEEITARYLSKVDRSDPDGCHEWTDARNEAGYGWFRTRERPVLAHRFGYELRFGPIPEGLYVCHSCDNPPCNNENHWFLGTVQQNNEDRDAKGRNVASIGESNGSAKLTEAEVLEIRKRYEAGDISQARLGDEFGVSKTLVRHIVKRRIWKHL